MNDNQERSIYEQQPMTVVRRRGRPRIMPHGSTPVRVPDETYDALYRAASQRRTTVPDLVRSVLAEFCSEK